MAPRGQYGAIGLEMPDNGSIVATQEETTPLKEGDDGDEEPFYMHRGPRHAHRWFWVVGSLVMVAMVGILAMALTPSDPHDDHDHEDYSSLASWNLSPPNDLGYLAVEERAPDALPSTIWGNKFGAMPLPTNSWYLNLISKKAASSQQGPDDSTRVYTYPYILDTAPAAPMTGGIRIHWPVLQASDRNMQMVYNANNGLSLGTLDTSLRNTRYLVDEDEELSLLGVSIQWQGDDSNKSNSSSGNGNGGSMKSHIVRGMPYATMRYSGGMLPTLFSALRPMETPIVDGSKEVQCTELFLNGTFAKHATTTDSKTSTAMTVEKEILMHFKGSDFTWVVFFSRPVQIECAVTKLQEFSTPGPLASVNWQLNVIDIMDNPAKNEDDDDDVNDDELVVRVALVNQCTSGKSDMVAHCSNSSQFQDIDAYLELLRSHAHLYPKTPKVALNYNYTYTRDHNNNNNNERVDAALVEFDWDVQSSKRSVTATTKSQGPSDSQKGRRLAEPEPITTTTEPPPKDQVLMYALPHHQTSLQSTESAPVTITKHCISTFHGSTCLVEGNTWNKVEDLSISQSFLANRPPQAVSIPALASAIATDLQYSLSSDLLRGAADTYFSGKILARLGRVLVITSELKDLAASAAGGGKQAKKRVGGIVPSIYPNVEWNEYSLAVQAAAKESLPSDEEIADAVAVLKQGVQIWLQPEATEAPFVYDKSWGGLVNCGCIYVKNKGSEGGVCNNTFPNCPALKDVNMDFGNGYYNDHHFHYGYHIYAAAVVAKYDPEWGREYFDRVMLFVRDIATPSPNDKFFTQFRQKDFYLGSSWASGIISAENSPHGRNEESSSEAIAAYEGVALYGQVMMDIFGKSSKKGDSNKQLVAKDVRDIGQFLTVTEVRAANRYWHVWNSPTHKSTYPSEYKEHAVGMLYETMASFQTWFSPAAFVSYGIQLLPLTPVAEIRDDPEWAAELYPMYKKSCSAQQKFCTNQGWSILELSLLATAGKPDEALKAVSMIPKDVFASQGACGNSLTNTIWFMSTRKPVDIKMGNDTNTDLLN